MACWAAVTSERRFHSLAEAKSILHATSLTGKALENVLHAFRILAKAEGWVHGVAPEQAHFSWGGALDALADIAGACGNCQYLDLYGGCRQKAYYYRGDLRAEDPTCIIEQKIMDGGR